LWRSGERSEKSVVDAPIELREEDRSPDREGGGQQCRDYSTEQHQAPVGDTRV